MSTQNDYSQPTYESQAAFEAYPDTEEGWRELYDWRWKQYLMSPYSAVDQKREHLFRAFDDSGHEMDQTKRLFRFYGFVVDVDARALHGGGLTLETHDRKPGMEKDAQLLAGEAVWNRSRINGEMLPLWCRMLCALGDYWIEPVRMSKGKPHKTCLVGYDPRAITPTYDDATGTVLEKVEIDMSFLPEAMREKGGPMGLMSRYKRVLTKTDINVYLDGKLVADKSGPHGLGCVPAVHLRAMAWDAPEHSLPAPSGIERGLMRLDGFVTQAGAIATRFGNPTFMTQGFKIGAGADVFRHGRMIDGAPKPGEGDAKYIESGGTAMAQLLPWAQAVIDHIRDTTPEFLFADSAAAESAQSRSLRAQAFQSKMDEMRGGVYAALCEVTAMAVAMDEGRGLDRDVVPYRIDAPPVMAINAGIELDNLIKVAGYLKRADITRTLQRLKIAPTDVDPDLYTAEVQDEQATMATAFFTDPNAEVGSADPAADPGAADPAPVVDPNAGKVADTALTGVQIQEMKSLFADVSAGKLAAENAVYTFLRSFPGSDEVEVRRQMGLAAAFTPEDATPPGDAP